MWMWKFVFDDACGCGRTVRYSAGTTEEEAEYFARKYPSTIRGAKLSAERLHRYGRVKEAS